MSKRNRKNHPVAQKPLPPKPDVSQPKPAVETEADKRQDSRINISLIGTGASVALNVCLAAIAIWSGMSASNSAKEAAAANKLAQVAQDRATGKIQAQFEFADDEKRDPNRFKEFMRKKDGSEQLVFRIESADDFLRWSPQVRIKNTGSEPIDAIKTDVHYMWGCAYGVGVQQIEPTPIVVNEVSTHEATDFGKLLPGQTAVIHVAPLLLNQISRLNWRDYADRDHLGMFTVRISCRLVGAASYDRIPDDQPRVFTFHWRPAGFQRDAKNVKELLEVKPLVWVEK